VGPCCYARDKSICALSPRPAYEDDADDDDDEEEEGWEASGNDDARGRQGGRMKEERMRGDAGRGWGAKQKEPACGKVCWEGIEIE